MRRSSRLEIIREGCEIIAQTVISAGRYAGVVTTLRQHAAAAQVVWCQEEPLNMGAWSYIWSRLEQCVGPRRVRYAGRDRASSPAAGSKAMHLREQKKLVEKAFSV